MFGVRLKRGVAVAFLVPAPIRHAPGPTGNLGVVGVLSGFDGAIEFGARPWHRSTA